MQNKSANAKFHHAGSSVHGHEGNTGEETNESIKVKARVWQSGEPPKQAFHDIRKKFGSLEQQLQSIERYVTSSEYTVAREINKL